MTQITSSHRRLSGVVISTAMPMTAVIRVDRRVAHSKYGKYFIRSKKFQIHDPAKAAHLGDMVEFEECRPLSRHKRWRYIATLKNAASSAPTV